MKVILLENLKKIGSIGEVIDVKRGFARNFLISNKKALYASKTNIKEVEKIKSELSKKDNEKKHHAKKILEIRISVSKGIAAVHPGGVLLSEFESSPLQVTCRGEDSNSESNTPPLHNLQRRGYYSVSNIQAQTSAGKL